MLPEGDCQVWWADVQAVNDRLASLLDEAETARWSRLRHDPLYLVAHATARLVCARLLGEPPARVRLTATCRYCGGPHGRSRVDHVTGRLCVSLSHSGSRVAVAVARTDVGIDVERIALRGKMIPVGALSPRERAHLDTVPEHARTAAFVRYWTRKEAVLKATGHGVISPPGRLTVTPPSEPPELLDWPEPHPEVFMTDLSPGPGYHASLAVLGTRPRVVEHDATRLLTTYNTLAAHQPTHRD